MNTNEYLDAAKTRLNIESDYALAKWLEINQGYITGYRSGKVRMDNYIAARIANLLEINPLQVIADTNAEREKCDRKRAFWRELVKDRQRPILGIVLLLSMLGAVHEISEHVEIGIMRNLDISVYLLLEFDLRSIRRSAGTVLLHSLRRHTMGCAYLISATH